MPRLARLASRSSALQLKTISVAYQNKLSKACLSLQLRHMIELHQFKHANIKCMASEYSRRLTDHGWPGLEQLENVDTGRRPQQLLDLLHAVLTRRKPLQRLTLRLLSQRPEVRSNLSRLLNWHRYESTSVVEGPLRWLQDASGACKHETNWFVLRGEAGSHETRLRFARSEADAKKQLWLGQVGLAGASLNLHDTHLVIKARLRCAAILPAGA